MTAKNPNLVSIALTMHDAERLRRLAASARTNEGRMALKLLSDMLDRQVRVCGASPKPKKRRFAPGSSPLWRIVPCGLSSGKSCRSSRLLAPTKKSWSPAPPAKLFWFRNDWRKASAQGHLRHWIR
jgi:hypothetical protein